MTDTDRLLRLNEVARLFGVDSHTVRGWVKAGKIPHLRTPGGQLRFAAAEVYAIRNRGAS